jgi:hypothetical protein
MSTFAASVDATSIGRAPDTALDARVWTYFFSDRRRAIQTVLGVIWTVDGGLQFQAFMYSRGFVEFLQANAPGQPGWLHSSILWGAHVAGGNLTVYDTLFGLFQVAVGFGLLYRPTVKAAIVASLPWAFVVWIFGEGAGMVFMGAANPLTGAPGAVLIYALVGLIVWPNGRRGGLLGVRGARTSWVVLWGILAYLWLLGPNSSANATSGAINAAPSGMSWLTEVQDWVADAAKGNGLPIALVLGAISLAIALSIARGWRVREFLLLSIVLNLVYWVVGQGFGGIFEGGATDPNAGLLFIVLAWAMYTVMPDLPPLFSHTRKAVSARRAALEAG